MPTNNFAKCKNKTFEPLKTPKTPNKNYFELSKYADSYDILEIIGTGDYSDCYVVRSKEPNKPRKFTHATPAKNNSHMKKDEKGENLKQKDVQCKSIRLDENSMNDNDKNIQAEKIMNNLEDRPQKRSKIDLEAQTNSMFDFNIQKEELSSRPFYKSSFSTYKNYNKIQTPQRSSKTFVTKKVVPKYCLSDSTLTCFKVVNRNIESKEVEILKHLIDKPFLLQFKQQYENNLLIETEFCGLGNLKQLIKKLSGEKLSLHIDIVYKMMYEISVALKQLHQIDLLHMDIKPDNIFIRSHYEMCNLGKGMQCESIIDKNNIYTDRDPKIEACTNALKNSSSMVKDYSLDKTETINTYSVVAKTCSCYARFYEDIIINADRSKFTFVLGDFNISKFKSDSLNNDGEFKYMPHEILLNTAYESSDVYSLGMVFLELLVGELPRQYNCWLNLRKNCYKNIRWNNTSKNDKAMVKKMIQRDHTKRIKLDDIIEYFSKSRVKK